MATTVETNQNIERENAEAGDMSEDRSSCVDGSDGVSRCKKPLMAEDEKNNDSVDRETSPSFNLNISVSKSSSVDGDEFVNFNENSLLRENDCPQSVSTAVHKADEGQNEKPGTRLDLGESTETDNDGNDSNLATEDCANDQVFDTEESSEDQDNETFLSATEDSPKEEESIKNSSAAETKGEKGGAFSSASKEICGKLVNEIVTRLDDVEVSKGSGDNQMCEDESPQDKISEESEKVEQGESTGEVTESGDMDVKGDCSITKAVNTEPITEVLKELLKVSPDRGATNSPSNSDEPRDRSVSASAALPSRENTSHSIALDDPAIVTSSDICSSGLGNVSSTAADVPSEGDAGAHIMNLLRKGFQTDLVNKGDGDSACESKPLEGENINKKAMERRSRLDSAPAALPSTGKDGHRSDRPVREMLVRRQASQTSMPVSDKPVLETLTFGTSLDEINTTGNGRRDSSKPGDTINRSCPCPLCERTFPAENKEDVLAHLVLVHKFVIADVNFIGNLSVYLRYWKERLKTRPVTEFCSKIVTNTGVKDEAEKEEFYLLCDALPEDKDIREQLQRKKLEQVLAQQQLEREETKFCRQCLFCKQTFCGNRAVLFDHLLRDHMFHMGQPDNLVFTDELFDLIQFKLDSQLCLFCEKSFKDKPSLREHMRKKQHRKINPKNKEYDRFYIINYMEMGKNWESLQQEDARLIKSEGTASDEEDEWADWNEECQAKVVCLFCDSASDDQSGLQNHMKETHNFDLREVNQKLQLNFYQKVKLINFIRRQVYHKTCYGCQESFPEKPELVEHMSSETDHINKLPAASIWDQSQYFFPTYEDDNLLCHLDDDDDGAAGDALGVTVYPEDIPVTDNTLLRDHKLRRELLKA